MTSTTTIGTVTTCLDVMLDSKPLKPETVSSGSLKRKRQTAVDGHRHSESDGLDRESCRMLEYVPKIGEFFRIIEKIGEGTFSSVYLAALKGEPQISKMFALKHIIPTSHPSRIENELRCLQLIGGEDNVIGVSCCIRERDHVVIVMPYFSHDNFQSYLQTMSAPEICNYMRHLITALRRVHQFNIIHRDVKPSNFLYDRKTNSFALVDFGLAHKATLLLKDKKTAGEKSTLSPGKRKTRQSVENKISHSPQKSNPANTTSNVDEKHQNILKNGKTAVKVELGEIPKPDIPQPKPLPVTKKPFKSPRSKLLKQRTIMANPGVALPSRDGTRRALEGSFAQRRGMSKPFGYKGQGQVSCHCFGLPSVCTLCVSRANQSAPRAGTPGYRAPEVLMKCPSQSTAVDMWSAGVIFLSLLTRRYPFFRANDDMTALAQIISVMGSSEVQAAALTYSKNLICSPNQPAAYLQSMCIALRRCNKSMKHGSKRHCPEKSDTYDPLGDIPDSAYDLLKCLLDVNPSTRITADEALKHPYLAIKHEGETG